MKIHELSSLGQTGVKPFARARPFARPATGRVAAQGTPMAQAALRPGGNNQAAIDAARAQAARQDAQRSANMAKLNVAQARALANKARSNLRSRNNRAAGVATVQHLAKTRDAIQAAGTAQKAQIIAERHARASVHSAEAERLRDLAIRQRSAGQTAAALNTDAKAGIAAELAAKERRGAEIIRAAPIKVAAPPEVNADRLAQMGATFNMRVSRRDAAAQGKYDAILATLQGIGGVLGDNVVDFTDFAGAVNGYGGGAVGTALAAAEFGNVAVFDRALKDISTMSGLGSISLAGLNSLGGYCDSPPATGAWGYAKRLAAWEKICGPLKKIGVVASAPSARAVPTDGLAQQANDSKVYYIKNGRKYHVPNPTVAKDNFGTGWASLIVPVAAGALNPIPEGPWGGWIQAPAPAPPAPAPASTNASGQAILPGVPSAPASRTEMAQPTIVDIPQYTGPGPVVVAKPATSMGLLIGGGAAVLGLGFLLLRRRA